MPRVRISGCASAVCIEEKFLRMEAAYLAEKKEKERQRAAGENRPFRIKLLDLVLPEKMFRDHGIGEGDWWEYEVLYDDVREE